MFLIEEKSWNRLYCLAKSKGFRSFSVLWVCDNNVHFGRAAATLATRGRVSWCGVRWCLLGVWGIGWSLWRGGGGVRLTSGVSCIIVEIWRFLSMLIAVLRYSIRGDTWWLRGVLARLWGIRAATWWLSCAVITRWQCGRAGGIRYCRYRGRGSVRRVHVGLRLRRHARGQRVRVVKTGSIPIHQLCLLQLEALEAENGVPEIDCPRQETKHLQNKT